MRAPITASLSGLWPRLIGVLFKRVPKFGILLGYSYVTGEGGEPGFAAATAASILSAPFINPVRARDLDPPPPSAPLLESSLNGVLAAVPAQVRMIEKQQRAYMKETGMEKPLMEILRESAQKYFLPLFRGTIPLMGHSLASAVLGLVGQPRYAQPCLASHSVLALMV